MKQKREFVVLLVLFAIAAVVWVLYFQQDRPTVVADTNFSAQNYQVLSRENPHIRSEELDRSGKTEYKSAGRNIFNTASLPPRVAPLVPKPDPSGPKVPLPEPPPPPLVLPGKFFGFGTIPNGTARVAFLSDNDEVYILREGEIYQKRFRIIRINNSSMEFEELSSSRRGTAPLEDQGGSPPQ